MGTIFFACVGHECKYTNICPHTLSSVFQIKFQFINFQIRFGFGIMDAEIIVNMAKLWNNVPAKIECTTSGIRQKFSGRSGSGHSGDITENDIYEIVFSSECKIDSLEHVQAVINVDHPVRGQLEVNLKL